MGWRESNQQHNIFEFCQYYSMWKCLSTTFYNGRVKAIRYKQADRILSPNQRTYCTHLAGFYTDDMSPWVLSSMYTQRQITLTIFTGTATCRVVESLEETGPGASLMNDQENELSLVSGVFFTLISWHSPKKTSAEASCNKRPVLCVMGVNRRSDITLIP